MQAVIMWETVLRLYQMGELAQAEQMCRALVAQTPDRVDAWTLLAVLCCRQGRLDDGIEACLQALAIRPEDVQALEILGDALEALGEWGGAAEAFRRAAAAAASPNWSLHAKQAAALRQCGRWEEAAAAYDHAVAAGAPEAVRVDAARLHLTMADHCAEGLEDALEHFRAAARLDPANTESLHKLGLALQILGRFDDAIAQFRTLVSLRPADAGAYTNLGNALFGAKRLDEAAAVHRQAVALRPDYAKGHVNLGFILGEMGELEEAVACYRTAIACDPAYADTYVNLATLLRRQGFLSEGDAVLAQALAIDPDHPWANGNKLFYMCGLPEVTPQAILDQACGYGRRLAARVEEFTNWSCDPAPTRLRVGLVSGDLRAHPVGYFLDSVLGNLDPARIEVVAYPTAAITDAVTERLRDKVAAWTSLVGLDDEAAARRIHDDGIHVLVDLAGHTDGNRLPLFVRRPAPVQATWLGYFGTTGLAQMDYILGDPQVTPPAEDGQYCETVWRLPETYLCYSRPDDAPAVGPLPALAAGGAVTFGCFNVYSKISDAVVACWARILHAVPTARLLIRNPLMDQPAMREKLLDRLGGHGIAASRLILEGRTSRADMWAAYNRVDMILDTFPYPGVTTSAEALWMGVPVLTRRGDRFLFHMGETVVRMAGLADWIAADDDDYVAKAVAFAAAPAALATIRAGLRDRLARSPLYDAPRFAGHLEQALWGMWRQSGPARLTAGAGLDFAPAKDY